MGTEEKMPQDRKSSLPAKLIRKLGKFPDTALADEFGVPLHHVRRARVDRGIAPANREEYVWNKSQLALLGVVPDFELARRWGLAPNTVGNKRRKLGIPPAIPKTTDKQHRWTNEQLSWLGEVPDKEVAKRVGLSQTTVRQKRQVLGIEPYQPTRKRRDSKVWAEDDIALLGTMSDTKLAKQLGVTRNTVQDKRRQLNIASFASTSADKRWTPVILEQLGKVPDHVIAKQVGINVSAVGLFRNRRGIPPCRENRDVR